MRRFLVALPLVLSAAAILAAGAWQYIDFCSRQEDHLRAHRQYGEALLDALDGVAHRECRGGRYSKESLTEAFEQSLRVLGLTWLAITTLDEGVLVSAGRHPRTRDSVRWFDKPFEPMRPRGGGRGNRRGAGSQLSTLPSEQMVLVLVVSGESLAVAVTADRIRAIVTATALGLVVMLFAGAFWMRTRSLELRTALESSRRELAGLESLRRIGAGLVHETKNPLGVVRGFAERIVREPLDEVKLRQTAKAILDETDRTVARLDEFLLFSRPARLRRSRVEVLALFEELAVLLRPDFEGVPAELTIDCGHAVVDADHDQLRRLLINLLLNSVQAIEPGGQVRLSCQQSDRQLRLVVSDDGRGVPDVLRTTLFEPYVSGRDGGSGLGLSIASRIAADHGFSLRYEPNQPLGTRMTLEVPRQ